MAVPTVSQARLVDGIYFKMAAALIYQLDGLEVRNCSISTL